MFFLFFLFFSFFLFFFVFFWLFWRKATSLKKNYVSPTHYSKNTTSNFTGSFFFFLNFLVLKYVKNKKKKKRKFQHAHQWTFKPQLWISRESQQLFFSPSKKNINRLWSSLFFTLFFLSTLQFIWISLSSFIPYSSPFGSLFFSSLITITSLFGSGWFGGCC